MGTDMGDISTDHSTIPTMTGAAAVIEGTHHTPHPATAAAHTTFGLIDAPITTYTATQAIGMVTPHLKHTSSPTNFTHTTIPPLFHRP